VAGQGLLQCVLHEHVVMLLLLVHLSHVLLSFAARLQISLHVRYSCLAVLLSRPCPSCDWAYCVYVERINK